MATLDEITYIWDKAVIWTNRAKKLRILADDKNYDLLQQTRFLALATIHLKRARECLLTANKLIDENLNALFKN